MQGTNQRREPPRPPPARRTPLWMRALIALVVGNGLAYAGYLRYKSQSGKTVSQAEIPEISETKISFASTPAGAKVSEQGVVLGVTPFIRTYPRTASAQAREFTFELEGHSPAKIQAFLDQERIYVHTSLAPGQAVAAQPTKQTAPAEVASRPAEEAKVVAVERPVERPVYRRPRNRETREVPRVQDSQIAVTKLDDDAGEVPKLDDRRSGVPKVTEDESSTPKLVDDEGSVEKLDEKDRAVPKLDEDAPPRSKSGRNVPKLKE